MRHVLWLVVVLGLLIAGPLQAQVSQPDPTPEEIAACEAKGGTWDEDRTRPKGHCISDNAQRCAERGGDWRRVCLAQSLYCVPIFADAGKPCTNSSECQGGCVPRPSLFNPTEPVVGECAKDGDPCGCFSWVEKGRVVQGPCFD